MRILDQAEKLPSVTTYYLLAARLQSASKREIKAPQKEEANNGS